MCLEQALIIDNVLESLGAEDVVHCRLVSRTWSQRIDAALQRRTWLCIAPQTESLRFWRHLCDELPNIDTLQLKEGPLGFLKECLARWPLKSLSLSTELPHDPLDLDWPQSGWPNGTPASLKSLTRLELSFATIGGLERVANQLPLLTSLFVRRAQLYPEWHSPHCPARRISSYDWLCVCSPRNLHDLHSLAQQLPHLCHLGFGGFRDAGTDAPNTVLQVFRANCPLATFSFEMPNGPNGNGQLSEFLQRNALSHTAILVFQAGWLVCNLAESTAHRQSMFPWTH